MEKRNNIFTKILNVINRHTTHKNTKKKSHWLNKNHTYIMKIDSYIQSPLKFSTSQCSSLSLSFLYSLSHFLLPKKPWSCASKIRKEKQNIYNGLKRVILSSYKKRHKHIAKQHHFNTQRLIPKEYQNDTVQIMDRPKTMQYMFEDYNPYNIYININIYSWKIF